jgi:hypothetical protein
MDSSMSRGMGIALAVSALISATACGGGGAKDDKPGEQASRLMCEGGNSCAGHSECASAESASSCKGTNSCAGQGWVYADSDEECAMLQEANKAS